jgi:hypothetical protein
MVNWENEGIETGWQKTNISNIWRYLFFVAVVLGFKLKASRLLGKCCTTWATPPILFVEYFQDRVSRTICPGWPWTAILLISEPWVARITGVNYQCPAEDVFLLMRKKPHSLIGTDSLWIAYSYRKHKWSLNI